MVTDHPYSLNQDAIEGVLRFICRKEGLRDDRAEEFSQWTRLKLIENDCAILRSFKGTSSFKTFLITVVQNKYRDWLDQGLGKFRSSADARRLGAAAINLERLVMRDGMTYQEATQLLVSKGIASSIAQCDELWAQLKRGARRQFVSDEHLENREASPSPDPLEDEERQRLTRKVQTAFRAALGGLAPADQLIFKLRYWDAVTVARIAQLQQTDQKALYRRFEQLLKHLQRDMRQRGITDAELGDLFSGLGIDFDDVEGGGGK